MQEICGTIRNSTNRLIRVLEDSEVVDYCSKMADEAATEHRRRYQKRDDENQIEK